MAILLTRTLRHKRAIQLTLQECTSGELEIIRAHKKEYTSMLAPFLKKQVWRNYDREDIFKLFLSLGKEFPGTEVK